MVGGGELCGKYKKMPLFRGGVQPPFSGEGESEDCNLGGGLFSREEIVYRREEKTSWLKGRCTIGVYRVQ